MSAHAKLSASGSERWIRCAGSVAAESAYPEQTSVFAQEGTAAHELAELCLTQLQPAIAYLDQQLPESNAYTVTPEMADYVQVYVDYVKSLGGIQLYEQRVDFSDWVQDGFGTSDTIAIVDDTLHVVDLKYGKGVKVYAQGNTQGQLYALGAYSDYHFLHDFSKIQIHIVQPRLDHIDVSDVMSVEELLKFGEFISQKAEEALLPDAKRNAGEKQCQFCKAKAQCGELKRYTEKIILKDFDGLTELDNADTLSDQQLRSVMDSKKLVLSWFDSIESLVIEKLHSGQGFEGYKLVEGRSIRDWGNEDNAAKVLIGLIGEEQAYSRKLVSVTQAEKILGKQHMGEIAELIIKPAGKPTLAPESDKRPAINISADSFDF